MPISPARAARNQVAVEHLCRSSTADPGTVNPRHSSVAIVYFIVGEIFENLKWIVIVSAAQDVIFESKIGDPAQLLKSTSEMNRKRLRVGPFFVIKLIIVVEGL